MAEVTQQIIDAHVVAASQAGAQEAAARDRQGIPADGRNCPRLSRARCNRRQVRLALDGPGLIVLLKSSRETAVLTMPASLGILPDWCAKPDADGKTRLGTLAQELGMNLLPETWLAHDFHAAWVENLAEALEQRRSAAPMR